MTASELVERGNELAAELTGITKLEYARSRVNAKIKPKKERVGELAVIIENKREERDVKCEWFHDWQGGKKTLRRMDTFEELETDIIREWERQQHLKFTGEVAPGGYDVDDAEMTETDEKARRVLEGEPEASAAICLYHDTPCEGDQCDGWDDCQNGAVKAREAEATIQ